MTLAQRLRLRRKRLGISQKALAREAGKCARVIGSWEREDRWPTSENLEAWTRALGVRIELRPARGMSK